MAAPVKAVLDSAYANDSWLFVKAIADIREPVVTEIEAATGFNLSCSVFGDTQEGVSATTEKVTRPRLNCERETYSFNGATNYDMADLTVAFRPQSDDGSDGRKAWDTMEDYSTGFLVRRQGVDSTTAITAGQRVDVIPAQLAVKVPTKTSNDAAGVYAFTQAVSITGQPAWNVEVQAA